MKDFTVAANDPHPDAGAILDAKLASILKEIGIPPRPSILEQIAREARRDDPDFNHITALISRDVGIAAGLMKTANSAYFGYRQKAHNVHEALVMLGLNVTARTVAGLILRKVLPSGPHLERFWDASDRIAQLSGWLVQKLGTEDRVRADDAHTFGLFRDCGIPIMMRKFENYHATLAEANGEAERSFTDVEETRHPTNHAMIGCLMAQSWWLPETIALAIRHHHDHVLFNAGAGGLLPASRRLIATAQLAEYLLQQLTGLNRAREWDKMGSACLSYLDLEEGGLATLQAEAHVFLNSLEKL